MPSTKSCRKTNSGKPASLPVRLVFFATLILAAAFCFSQDTTIRSESNLVLVPTLVKDSHDQIMYGLAQKDFIVEDDGVEQSVRLDEAPDGQPISLIVAIQRGRRAPYEFPRMQGLKTMLYPLFTMGNARVALVEFDSQVKLVRDFTRDEALIDADLDNLQPGDEGAKILDAVNFSVGMLKNQPQDRMRVLLLICETRDHGSKVKIEDAVAAIGQSNSVMYALSFSPGLSNIFDTARGNNMNEMHQGVNFLDLAYRAAQAMRKNAPSTIAAMTGGEYELFTTKKKFETRINDFTNHLYSRYLLSFAPKDPHPGLHQIRVRLKDNKDAVILARATYWANTK